MKQILIFICLIGFVAAQDSKELLRDGLFAEESEGDLKTAAEKYEILLEDFERERKVAAVALFRLAEVCRKQGQEQKAILLFQRVLTDFQQIEPQARMARESLVTMGKAQKEVAVEPASKEDSHLATIKRQKASMPDTVDLEHSLRVAVKRNWDRLLDYTLDEGVDVTGSGALAVAANQANLKYVKFLLEKGADPNAPKNHAALHGAIHNQYWEVVQALIAGGAKVSVCAPDCLIGIGFTTEDLEWATALMKAGAELDYVDPDSTTPNLVNGYPFSPLHDAVVRGNKALVDLLLKAGANVDLVHPDLGITALHLAAWKNKSNMVECLLKAGADPNLATIAPEQRNLGIAPFHESVIPLNFVMQDEQSLRLFMEHGAKLSPKSFLLQVSQGNMMAVQVLCESGISPEGESDYELRPLEAALTAKKTEMVQLLRKLGAAIHDEDWESAPSDVLLKWFRELRYPEYATRKGVTLVYPELNRASHVIPVLTSPSDHARLLLGMGFPQHPHRSFFPKPASLTWRLIRKGKIEKITMKNSGFLKLQNGDIIEVVDFPYSRHPYNVKQEKILKNFEFDDLVDSLRSQIRIPFTLEIKGEKIEMLMRGDRVTYEVGSHELPLLSLGRVLNILRVGFWYQKRSIVIKKNGLPDLELDRDDNDIYLYEIEPGDLIRMPSIDDSADGQKEMMKKMKNDIVIYCRSSKLNGWRFKSGEWFQRPTLLQALAHINAGFSLDRLSVKLQRDGRNSRGLLEDTALLKQTVRATLGEKAVVPGIDLSDLRILQINSDGILDPEFEKKIDLNEHIKIWHEKGEKDEPFDLELAPGQLVNFSLKKKPWKALSEIERRYFEAALRVSIFRGGEDLKFKKWTINYRSPEWITDGSGTIPIVPFGAVSTLRGMGLVENRRDFMLRRTGNDLIDMTDPDTSKYWPRQDDVVKFKKSRSKATRPRVRYVPGR